MAEKRLIVEIKQLSKEADNPQILQLGPAGEDDLFRWRATIAKPSKDQSDFYYNGQWDLEIKVPATYPIIPPTISFSKNTPIAHPNIDLKSGEICLDILKLSGWSPAWNLNYLVVAILMLIDDPEPDLPLNIDMANLYRYDKVGYESMCQYTMWKHGTFVTGKDGELLRHASGIKTVEGKIISEEEEIKANAPDFKVVHEVEQEVTKQFLDKVNATHSASGSEELAGEDLDSVRQIVSHNVSRQVELIYQNSATVPLVAKVTKPADDAAANDIKSDFERLVDEQVALVRLRQQEQSNSNKGQNTLTLGSESENEPVSEPEPEHENEHEHEHEPESESDRSTSSLKKFRKSISRRSKTPKKLEDGEKKRFSKLRSAKK